MNVQKEAMVCVKTVRQGGQCGQSRMSDGEHNGRLTQRINGENSIGPLQAIVRVLVYIL